MPAKSRRNTRTRLPRNSQPIAAKQDTTESSLHQGEETAVDPSATPPSPPESYQVGDLWDERETEFFRPYLEMVRRRGSSDGGQDDRAADHPPG